MAVKEPTWPPHLIRFGNFELDTRAGELRKGTGKTRLGENSLRVLLALLERPGEVVTREELRRKLWLADTFVDFEDGLNHAVRKLREALGDDAETPSYMQTVPRRGYRFIYPIDATEGLTKQAGPQADLETHQPAERGNLAGKEVSFYHVTGVQEELKQGSESGKAHALIPPFHRVSVGAVTALVLLVAAVAIAAVVWLRSPRKVTDRSEWVQVTNLPDSVSQPAVSPDGRMLTFIRGPFTFAGLGQIYVKMLPDGEPVQLTRDNSQKMSPVFSPDGSQIAYTAVGSVSGWDTWLVPVLGGQPRLWLPNASGLVWSGKGKILFSEIKNHDVHMGIVTAEESRAGERNVYLPSDDRGMAHRSYPSPDGKSALVVEMSWGQWLPCRLVPMDGSSAGRQVGPAEAACTSAAWSPDGKWMYLNSNAGGAFHVWRQRFPDGQPEQITSGPTEQEGISMARDGRSFITSVGMKQSSVWVHDSRGERQVSLEGYSYDPKFTPDGKTLCYRISKGTLAASESSQLRAINLESGTDESLLPGFAVTGVLGRAYDISRDGQQVVVTALDKEGRQRLWLAPLDRHSPPHQIPDVQGGMPVFGPEGEIFFIGFEGNSSFACRVRQDGTGLRRAIEQPVVWLYGISWDGQWLAVELPGKEGRSTVAFPLRAGSPVPLTAPRAFDRPEPVLRWSPDGKRLFITVQSAMGRVTMSGHTYVVPLPEGQMLPRTPAGGFQTEADIAKLPGVRLIDALQVAPSPTAGAYAFVRVTVQRNLFRVPLP